MQGDLRGAGVPITSFTRQDYSPSLSWLLDCASWRTTTSVMAICSSIPVSWLLSRAKLLSLRSVPSSFGIGPAKGGFRSMSLVRVALLDKCTRMLRNAPPGPAPTPTLTAQGVAAEDHSLQPIQPGYSRRNATCSGSNQRARSCTTVVWPEGSRCRSAVQRRAVFPRRTVASHSHRSGFTAGCTSS